MRSYDDLTEQGKIRRLHLLARQALAEYGIEIQRLRCVARDTNTTFRVDTATGDTFALRVGVRPDDTDVHTESELAWLDALAGEPHIDAVVPHRNRHGDLVTLIDHPGVIAPRKCVLFGWLPGGPIDETASSDDYRLLGELTARLHDHAERWHAPGWLRPLVWDRIFYYPTEPVVLYEPLYRKLMNRRRTEIVREVERRAAAELRRLHRDGRAILLHGDLNPWNVHRYRGRLLVFDFEDMMLGTPVQDVAIALYYIRYRPDYAELMAAYRSGYTTLRPWPVEYEGQLELLMAARRINFINYVLRMDFDPAEYVPKAVDRLEPVLSS